jgi:hypothetical protein
MYYLRSLLFRFEVLVKTLLIVSIVLVSGCGGSSSSEESEQPNTLPNFLNEISDFNIEVGAALNINLIAQDINDDPLEYEFSGLPSFIHHQTDSAGELVFAIEPEAGDEGPYSIEISLSDGKGDINTSFNMNVIDSDSSTLLESIDDQTIDEEGFKSLSYVIDTRFNESLVISNVVSPDFLTIRLDEGVGVDLTPKLGDSGFHEVSFVLSDGYRTQTISFSVTVGGYNFSPSVELPESISMSEGETLSVSVISDELKDSISIYSSSLPEFTSLVQAPDSGSSLLFQPNTLQSGNYNITLVFDNGITQSEEFVIPLLVTQSYSGDISDLSAGAYHTCAIENDSAVCWGLDDVGQSTVPEGLGSIVAISAGSYHTCAATELDVSCWGMNSNGEANAPSDLSDVIKLDAGYEHSCALLVDGTVECWGSNEKGQIEVPDSLGMVTDISVGFWHTCAKDESGLRCWGDNSWGQSTVPGDLSDVTLFSAGRLITCAVDDTELRCWGTNDGYGQSSLPIDLSNISALDVGYFYNTCILEDDIPKCWGAGTSDNNSWPRFGQATLPLDLESVSEISAGDTHACAIDDKGVICWGEGEDGDNYSSYNYDQGIVPDYLRE